MKYLRQHAEIRSLLFLSMLVILSCRSDVKKQTVTTNTNEFKTDTVLISQMRFNPAVITINKGDTIIWINHDMVAHNVTSQRAGAFYSDTINVGKSWKYAPADSAGFYCSIHPTMTGKIVIK